MAYCVVAEQKIKFLIWTVNNQQKKYARRE